MKTRLKSCDRWHVGEEAILLVKHRKNSYGAPRTMTRCTLCDSIRCKYRRVGLAPPPRSEHGYTPYGVLPRLDWAPPQQL